MVTFVLLCLSQKDERDNRIVFSDASMVPKLSTGLEDKPLLPSVFRPESSLYTAPMNIVPKPYLDYDSGLTNTLQVNTVSSNDFIHSNIPPIHAPVSAVVSTKNFTNLQVNYNAPWPLHVSVQNQVDVSNLTQACQRSFDVQNQSSYGTYDIVPVIGSDVTSIEHNTSILKPHYTVPIKSYARIQPYHHCTPITIANFDNRVGCGLASQNVDIIPCEDDAKPVAQVKTLNSNLKQIDIGGRPNISSVKPSSAKNTLAEHSSDVPIKSGFPIFVSNVAKHADMKKSPFEGNSVVNDHSSVAEKRRPFFGGLNYNSYLRRSASPVGSSNVGRDSKELTGDYQDIEYMNVRENERSPYSDRSVESYIFHGYEETLKTSKLECIAGDGRDYYHRSPTYIRGDNDLYRKYDKDANRLSPYDRSSYSDTRDMFCMSKEPRNYSYDRDEKDRSRGNSRQNDWRDYSNSRRRSRSPIQTREHSFEQSCRERSEKCHASFEDDAKSFPDRERPRSIERSKRRKSFSPHSPRSKIPHSKLRSGCERRRNNERFSSPRRSNVMDDRGTRYFSS